MRLYFSFEMDDLGRMETRILALFERLRAKLVSFSSRRAEDRILIKATIEIEEVEARRVEALAFRIEGMRHVSIGDPNDDKLSG